MMMMQNNTNGIASDEAPGKAKFRQIFDNCSVSASTIKSDSILLDNLGNLLT